MLAQKFIELRLFYLTLRILTQILCCFRNMLELTKSSDNILTFRIKSTDLSHDETKISLVNFSKHCA